MTAAPMIKKANFLAAAVNIPAPKKRVTLKT